MRVKELDALRGLAAFAVFLFHFQLFNYGYLGVHLFFIISGFVIYLSAKNVSKLSDFIIARIARLYPTYWVCLLFTFSVLYISGNDVTFIQLLYNLTMFQDFLSIKNIDGAYWSLTEELVFYVVIFAALSLGLIDKIKLWTGVMLTLAIIGLFLNPELSVIQKNIQSVVKYFNLFVAGVIFYQIYQKQKLKLRYVAVLILCLGIALMYSYGSYLDYFNHEIEMVIICSFFVLFTMLVLGKLAFLRKYKWLLLMGEISYPFYLLHQEIGLTIFRLFTTENQILNILLVIGYFIGIALVATFVNRTIEHNISRIVKYKLLSWFRDEVSVTTATTSKMVASADPAIIIGQPEKITVY